MKSIDKFLRFWRVNVALKEVPVGSRFYFDIGCGDGYLLNIINKNNNILYGCDPRHSESYSSKSISLINGHFPEVIVNSQISTKFDVIFALAVFEHFDKVELDMAVKTISQMLNDDGVLIVTVPSTHVDYILRLLLFFKLIDGLALDEHHSFSPNEINLSLTKSLKLEKHKFFQLGLNNLYVYKKS